MTDRFSDIPLPTTFYRKTLFDIVQYFENFSQKKPLPPKLLSYKRLPSVSRPVTDIYSDKDTASDSEVTSSCVTIPFVTRSCRSSPTAPQRFSSTYIDTVTLPTRFPFPPSSDTDSEMVGKKGAKTSPKPDNRSDDERKKVLRQSTLAKSKGNSTMGLVLSALPGVPGVPTGGSGGKKIHLSHVSTPAEDLSSFQLSPAELTPTGEMQDDSIDYANSPSSQQEHLLLQSQIAVGVGIEDPDLQATFDDPLHLAIPPGTFEEMEKNELERLRKLSTASDGSTSHLPMLEGFNTPKRKGHKKHKRAGNENDNDDSSSSTPVEIMEEGQPLTARRIKLAPTTQRLVDMDTKLSLIHI